jgi:hypothetical protein
MVVFRAAASGNADTDMPVQNPPPDFMEHRKDGGLLLVCFHLAASEKIKIPAVNPTILTR